MPNDPENNINNAQESLNDILDNSPEQSDDKGGSNADENKKSSLDILRGVMKQAG